MDCRYYLQIGAESVNTASADCIVADECIANLSDIELSLDRKDLSGLVKKLSNSWEFVGECRDRLVDYYLSHILTPKGSIRVDVINQSTFAFTKLWECPLDFASFSFDTYKCSINCLESGVLALIKAHKSTDYEYDVNDLRETYTSGSETLPKQLYYDGVKNLKSYGSMVYGDDYGENQYKVRLKPHDSWEGLTTMPLYYDASMMSQAIYMQDVPFKSYQHTGTGYPDDVEPQLLADDDNFHIEALKDSVVTIDATMLKGYSCYRPSTSQPETLHIDYSVRVVVKKADGTDPQRTDLITAVSHIEGGVEVDVITKNKVTLNLSKGDKVTIYNYVGSFDSYSYFFINIDDRLIVSWGERATPMNMNVIKPLTLLQSLVDSMCGANVADAEIDDTNNSVLSNTLILPAESVRNLDVQKVKTKFNDFCDFMEATFGYVYRVIGVGERNNNVKPIVQFLHRDNLFLKTFTNNRLDAKVLRLIAEPQFSVDSSKMYANLEIGYDKQDYDEDNAGRYEFNATNKYTTGCNLTDSTLSLICPYRADSYGLEELVIKTSTTKSTDSDDDIFIIHSNNDTANNRYTLFRTQDGEYSIAYTFDSESNFNVAFAPKYCIERSKSYIRMTSNLLTFVSMDTPSVGYDGEHAIAINGVAINADIDLTTGNANNNEPLFLPATIEVRTADLEVPDGDNRHKPVVFNWNEKNYYGYISSLDIKIDREESAKYKLHFYKSVNLPLWTDDAQKNRNDYTESEDPQTNWGDFSNDYNNDYNNG